MPASIEQRLEAVEAEVIALRALVACFMVASQRAPRFVTSTMFELAEAYCGDAAGAGNDRDVEQVRALLGAMSELLERLED